jgi:hypothetical protein
MISPFNLKPSDFFTVSQVIWLLSDIPSHYPAPSIDFDYGDNNSPAIKLEWYRSKETHLTLYLGANHPAGVVFGHIEGKVVFEDSLMSLRSKVDLLYPELNS